MTHYVTRLCYLGNAALSALVLRATKSRRPFRASCRPYRIGHRSVSKARFHLAGHSGRRALRLPPSAFGCVAAPGGVNIREAGVGAASNLSSSFLFSVVLTYVFELWEVSAAGTTRCAFASRTDTPRAGRLSVAPRSHAMAVVARSTHSPLDGRGASALRLAHVCGSGLHGDDVRRENLAARGRVRRSPEGSSAWTVMRYLGSRCGPPSTLRLPRSNVGRDGSWS